MAYPRTHIGSLTRDQLARMAEEIQHMLWRVVDLGQGAPPPYWDTDKRWSPDTLDQVRAVLAREGLEPDPKQNVPPQCPPDICSSCGIKEGETMSDGHEAEMEVLVVSADRMMFVCQHCAADEEEDDVCVDCGEEVPIADMDGEPGERHCIECGALPSLCEPCEGRGWIVMTGNSPIDVQRCDDCNRFATDEQAAAAAIAAGWTKSDVGHHEHPSPSAGSSGDPASPVVAQQGVAPQDDPTVPPPSGSPAAARSNGASMPRAMLDLRSQRDKLSQAQQHEVDVMLARNDRSGK